MCGRAVGIGAVVGVVGIVVGVRCGRLGDDIVYKCVISLGKATGRSRYRHFMSVGLSVDFAGILLRVGSISCKIFQNCCISTGFLVGSIPTKS